MRLQRAKSFLFIRKSREFAYVDRTSLGVFSLPLGKFYSCTIGGIVVLSYKLAELENVRYSFAMLMLMLQEYVFYYLQLLIFQFAL